MAGKEKKCQWYFADQPNGQEKGPNNPMEQNFKKYPYASLIRESIQNSLDAVLDEKKPVTVKFSFMEMNGLEFPSFFELQNHIKGCIDYYPNNPTAKESYKPMLDMFDGIRGREKISFIRISDYNTKGMDYEEDKTDSPFYAFVRSAGVSAKESNYAGGSFGFGKAAYFLLSPISTIIVSTRTQRNNIFFEGISSLCTHWYNGVKKVDVGYYDEGDGRPVTIEENIPAKFRRYEPGTDINIIGVDPINTKDAIKEMAEAALRNFWMAIYNGKLIVNIDDKVVISRDNIADFMERYFVETEDNTRKTNCYNPRPYFDAVRFANSSDKYQLFEETLPLLGHVCFYTFKKKGANDKIAYIRSIQMLVYSKRTTTNYGLYGVFFCDSQKGNQILRCVENPAHDEWKSVNWRVNGRVVSKGRDALQEIDDFISSCLSKVFSLKEKKAINIKGLEDFLYIPTTYEEDDEIETESLVGDVTGTLQDDGTSLTTDFESERPEVTERETSFSTGHVMINKATSADKTTDGSLRAGHGEADHKLKTKGIQKPGDAKEKRKEDDEGERGLFASLIDMPYRTFSQNENGIIYHYVVLHSQEEIDNVRLHFYAVGEENDEELQVAEANIGNISGNIIRDVHMNEGRMRIRVRFMDNMMHALRLSAEELYEV